MQDSFYREGSFEDAHSFCSLHDSVLDLVRQVSIQGKNLRRFTKTYSLDTWRQGASMWLVWLKAYSEIGHDKTHRIQTLAINWIQITVYQYVYWVWIDPCQESIFIDSPICNETFLLTNLFVLPAWVTFTL